MANIGSSILPLVLSNGASGGIHGADTLPLITCTGVFGLKSVLTLPLITSSGYAIVETVQGIDVLPLIVSSGVLLAGQLGHGADNLPLITSSGQGYSQVLARGANRLPLITSNGYGLVGVIGDGASILPLITSSGQAYPVLVGTGKDILPLILSYGYGRQIPITYIRRAVVMHLFSHAISEYENYNFNSLAHFEGFFLGTNENGLFMLGGKDDLGIPIQADIRTGIHDLANDGVMKLPKEAWMAYRTDGPLELGIEVEENKAPYIYTFDKSSTHRITEARKPLGKGLVQRFYTFIIKNKGSDFDLESLRILGDVISRKRR